MKVKKIIVQLSTVGLLFNLQSLTTFAQTPTTRTNIDIRATIAQERETTREIIRNTRKEAQTNIKEQREAMRERISDLKEQYRARLKELKDARKKNLVERVDNKLAMINKKRIAHFNKVLDRLEALLDKIRNRANTAKAAGADISSVEAAIATAESAIVTARNALSTQAGKEYVMELGDESTLRADVGKTVNRLASDLKELMKSILEAKEAVMTAARALAKVLITVTITPPAATLTVTPLPTL